MDGEGWAVDRHLRTTWQDMTFFIYEHEVRDLDHRKMGTKWVDPEVFCELVSTCTQQLFVWRLLTWIDAIS